MDIYTKPDSIVIFIGENGYDIEKENAKLNGLVKNKEYIVERIDVGSWTSYVYLEGFKRPFNTVMFKNKE